MNVFVLSELNNENSHIGWSVNHSLEQVLATSCQATFMYPRWVNDLELFVKQYSSSSDHLSFLKRYKHRIFKSWYKLDRLPTLKDGPNVLIVVGIRMRFLLSIFALGSLLDRFDVRVAYLLDGFDPTAVNKPPLPKLDHLFVISEELAEQMRSLHSINTSCLPLGVDTMAFGRHRSQRHLDIVGYGRTCPELHRYLQRYYNQPTSDRFYYHSTSAQPHVKSPKEHITLLNRLLERSKISLCFEVSGVPRFQGHSPLLYRWLEGWAGGCAIVGKKPFAKNTEKLMDWQDSTLEIPDRPQEWLPFFDALLDDETRLADISWRNYRECRLQHDWRYRLQEMFTRLNLPIPTDLSADIAYIRASVERVKDSPVGRRDIAIEQDRMVAVQRNATSNGSPLKGSSSTAIR
jgi:Glycosyl transferases group 1